MGKVFAVLLFAVVTAPLAGPARAATPTDVNGIAESYVKLVLEIGLYEPDYVDSYFGPPEWQPSDDLWAEEFPAEKLRSQADALIERLGQIDTTGFEPSEQQRCASLKAQLSSVRAKIDLLDGAEMTFDEESRAVYGVVAPVRDAEHFQRLLDKLDELLPGEGSLIMRFNGLRTRHTLSQSNLRDVFDAVTDECRRRTAEHLTLPDDESFEVQSVAGTSWAASVTYYGEGLSVVEVNMQMPFGLAEIITLSAHEIYPGHHTYLSLLEEHLYRGRGWVEYCVWPLTSPQSLIAEGLAEYGRRDLIGGQEMAEFERTVLCPLAGLDPNELDRYDQVMALKDELSAAVIDAARGYLDGDMTRDEAATYLARYTLTTPFGAESLLSFADEFGSYVATYTLGRDLIKTYIDRQAGPNATDAQRWTIFRTLLTTPQTPAGLRP